MRTNNTKPTTNSTQSLEQRVSRLEEDIKMLTKNASKNRSKSKRTRGAAYTMRSIGVASLVVLTAIFINLSTISVWLDRTLLDNDRWVEKTSAIISDPAVRADISRVVTSEVFEQADVESYIAQILPEQVTGLAVPLTSSMKELTTQRIDSFLQSEQFLQLWENASRSAHVGIIESLETGGAPNPDNANNLLYIEEEKLMLSLRPIYAGIQNRLSDAGLTFVDRIDTNRVNRTVELGELNNMPTIMISISLLQRSIVLLPLLAITSALGALYLARERRKVIIAMAILTGAMLVAGVQVIYIAQYPVISTISSSLSDGSTAAGQAIYNILTADLIMMNRVLLVISLFVVLGAYLSGPSSAASWLRNHVSSLVVGKKGQTPAVMWVAAHSQGLVVSAATITLGLLIFPLTKGPAYPVIVVGIAVIIIFIVLSIQQSSRRTPKK